jgi:hypothetical protein
VAEKVREQLVQTLGFRELCWTRTTEKVQGPSYYQDLNMGIEEAGDPGDCATFSMDCDESESHSDFLGGRRKMPDLDSKFVVRRWYQLPGIHGR